MPSKTSSARVQARERERQALELRKTGASYDVIASRLGCSHGAAYGAVKRALARLDSDIDLEARELRKLELERLDRATLAIYQQVMNGNLGAIDRLCRISELRAKYLQVHDRQEDQTSALDAYLSGLRNS